MKLQRETVTRFSFGRLRKLGALLAVALVVAATPFAVQPARAGVECFAPWLCLYEHARSGGNQINFYNPGTTCQNLPTPWNDRVSSIHNKTAYPIEFFHHAWCSGLSTTVPGNGYIGSYGSLFNDEITSFCRLPC
jgi:hypothetical protein